MKIGQVSLLVVLVLLLAGTSLFATPERRTPDETEKVIRGLKMGIAALKAIDRHEEATRVEAILTEWLASRKARKKRAASGEDSEIRIVKSRIETLRVAMKALLEVDALDAANLVEHKIHSYELAVEGRRDAKAMKIRTSAPKSEAMVKPLRRAGAVWKELGNAKKAKMCRALAEQYQEIAARRQKGGEGERARAKRHMEIMRIAMHGLLEAEKEDAAHRIEQVLHLYELSLAGERDEARKAREKAPNSGQLAELLLHAADLWKEFGHEGKAGQCHELGRFYQQRWKQQRAREKKAEAPRTDRDAKLAELEERLEKLHRMARELTNELERLKREM